MKTGAPTARKPGHVGEVHHPRHNGLSNKVVRECIMSLLQLGVRDTTALHNGLVVSEHEGLTCHWNSETSASKLGTGSLLEVVVGVGRTFVQTGFFSLCLFVRPERQVVRSGRGTTVVW